MYDQRAIESNYCRIWWKVKEMVWNTRVNPHTDDLLLSLYSGAGKTVSAKYIMRYFATADDQESSGKRKKTDGSMTEVEEQILGTCGLVKVL